MTSKKAIVAVLGWFWAVTPCISFASDEIKSPNDNAQVQPKNQSYAQQLEKELKIKKDAHKYFLLSKEYAAENKPELAFKAINEAVKLEPDNVEYLKSRGVIASWLDNSQAMADSYKRLLKLKPNDETAILGLARANTRMNNYKTAEGYYKQYLSIHEHDKEATIEFSFVLIWLGKHDDAKKLLDNYHERYGEDEKYQKAVSLLKKEKEQRQQAQVGEATATATGNPLNTIAQLKQQIRRNPSKGTLYFQLSQEYSAKNQPQQAFKAINQAVKLEPNNVKYLRNQSLIADWVNDLDVMEAANLRILALVPNDPQALLNLAQVNSRTGNYSKAVTYFQRYLAIKPKSKKVWLEYVDVEIWQENYIAALAVLEQYRALFGATQDYIAYKARTYASAGWYNTALDLNTPLLAKKPNSYYYNETAAISYHEGFQPNSALDSLSKLQQLQPKSDETKFLNRYIKRPISSTINFGGNYLQDTQVVKIWRGFGDINWFINPTTALFAGFLREGLTADTASGLTPVTGGNSTYDDTVKVGAYHRLNEYLALDGKVGGLKIKQRGNHFVYNAKGFLTPNEKVEFSYEFSHDLYRPDQFVAFSPRSVSLEVTQNANLFYLGIEPFMQKYLNVYGSSISLSDGNHSWEILAWPSFAFFRQDGLKVDLGAYANLLSYQKTLNNGYYSPKLAQLYLATMQLYYGFNDNTGLSISSGIGVVRDNTFKPFHFASDLYAELICGIYKDWQMIGYASHSYRGAPTGAYQSGAVGLKITRRFYS